MVCWRRGVFFSASTIMSLDGVVLQGLNDDRVIKKVI
jgi:hypothetical protein